MNQLIDTRTKLRKGLTWGVGLAGAVIVAPVAFLAVKGITGIAVAAAVFGACLKFAPPKCARLPRPR